IHIGDVTDPKNPYTQSHVFEFSPCHAHYHFTHYGTFSYAGAPGSKKAFCLEDTNRFHNDEFTPLTAVHQSCELQGMGGGWGEEYEFGLPGQWVDVTSVDTTRPHALTFVSNPDGFLCEGDTLGASGNPVDPTDLPALVFDPTNPPVYDSSGNLVSVVRCRFYNNWSVNNVGSVLVSSPAGSFVTDSCDRGQIGPSRDCGFSGQQKQQ